MTDETAGSLIAAILALATAVLRARLTGTIRESTPALQVLTDYRSFGGKGTP